MTINEDDGDGSGGGGGSGCGSCIATLFFDSLGGGLADLHLRFPCHGKYPIEPTHWITIVCHGIKMGV